MEGTLHAIGSAMKRNSDLDSRGEYLLFRRLLGKHWCLLVDRVELRRLDWAALIDGLTNDVDDSAERLGADGDSDGVASIHDRLSTHETLSGVESDRSHVVSTQVLGDLENETVTSALHLESIENGGKFTLELHVDDSTDNLGNLSSGAAKESYTRRQRNFDAKWFGSNNRGNFVEKIII